MRLDGDEWRPFFDSFQSSAFRLETLPQYLVPGEAEEFRAFLNGEKPPLSELEDNQWTRRVRAHTAAGKVMQRVHVVQQPLSDYLRFEFEAAYVFNVRAGEDIRILDVSETVNPGLPDMDFWMFDDAHVVHMRYKPDGTQIDRILLEDEDPAPYVRYKEMALAASEPFNEYVARVLG